MSEETQKMTRMTLEEMSQLLSTSPYIVSVERVQELVDRGAPLNDDGTLNIFRMAAWLFDEKVKQLRCRST